MKKSTVVKQLALVSKALDQANQFKLASVIDDLLEKIAVIVPVSPSPTRGQETPIPPADLQARKREELKAKYNEALAEMQALKAELEQVPTEFAAPRSPLPVLEPLK